MTLAPFSPEEGTAMLKKFQEFLDSHATEIVVTPIITKEGTIGAKVELFKKIELVPKGEPSPIMKDGKFIDDENNEGNKPVETKKP